MIATRILEDRQMTEAMNESPESVTIAFSRREVVGLPNAINHSIHGGFVIDELDCGAITGLSWAEFQALWKSIRDSVGLDKGIN